MASDEDALTAMLDRDQRSFQRVLFAGIAMIVVVMLIGGALVAQNFRTAQNLSSLETKLRQVEQNTRLEAHRLRQTADAAAIADNRRAMENRAAFEDIRNLIDASTPGAAVAGAAGAQRAAFTYLEGLRLPLVGERAIHAALASPTMADEPTRDLLTAIELMRRYDKSGAGLRADASGAAALTPELEDAAARLDRAAKAPALTQAALLGRARIDYILASANNFRRPLCDAMFQRVDALPRTAWSIQVLLNRAECWRKNGDSQSAHAEFEAAVKRLAATPANQERALSGSDADPLVQYQAYHGRGTTLIAIAADGDLEKLKQAQDDLQRAAALRKLGGQSELEVVGSLENLGLGYLKAGQYQQAARNAAEVTRVRSLGWNEVVRALSAQQLKDDDTFATSRENLANYRRAEFNECELKKLVGQRLEGALLDLLKVTRDGGAPATCSASPARPRA